MWLFCGHTGVIWLGARYFYSGMEDFQRTRLMDLLAPSYFIFFVVVHLSRLIVSL